MLMKTDPVAEDLINTDINELKIAAKNLIKHAAKLGGLAFGTSFLKWVASFAAMSVLFYFYSLHFSCFYTSAWFFFFFLYLASSLLKHNFLNYKIHFIY